MSYRNNSNGYAPRRHVTTIERGEFKGNPTISLPMSNPEYPFTFGLEKARVLLANIDAIKAFVADHEQAADPGFPAHAGQY